MSKQPASAKTRNRKLAPILALVALVGLAALGTWLYKAKEARPPSHYSVCLNGFNHTERYISKYSVNGQWGANISEKEPGEDYGGGGGFVCGASVGGEQVTVKWEFPMRTWDQMEKNIEVPPEKHEMTVPMPKAQSRTSRYLQVHIYPDNHVELQLNDDM